MLCQMFKPLTHVSLKSCEKLHLLMRSVFKGHNMNPISFLYPFITSYKRYPTGTISLKMCAYHQSVADLGLTNGRGGTTGRSGEYGAPRQMGDTAPTTPPFLQLKASEM